MMVNLPCLMVSCTNFLRPTYSYTECRLSSQTGSCPMGSKCYWLQLLFVFDSTDLLFTTKELIFQWTLSSDSFVGFASDADIFVRHLIFRFLIQNPAQFQMYSGTQQGAGLFELSVIMLPLLTADSFLRYRLTVF